MKKALAVTLAAAVLASFASVVLAAWTLKGTCGYGWNTSIGSGTAAWKDRRRIKFSAITVDNAGNIFATCNNWENQPSTGPGGITIFKTDNTVVNIDLAALGYEGPVTKLVVAGDGKVYALQNWTEIHWSFYRGYPSRVLRINLNGTVDLINCPKFPLQSDCTPPTEPDSFFYRGLTVGADGNVYYNLKGTNSYHKAHYLWRYDVVADTNDDLQPDVNNGWSEDNRMLSLEWVGSDPVTGQDWFAVVKSNNTHQWRADAISATCNRITVTNGTSSPGWGRDNATATVYDPLRKMLWAAGRGTAHTVYGGTNIMSRWRGDQSNPGNCLFKITTTSCPNTPDASVEGSDVWHANGNIPDFTGIKNFEGTTDTNATYWVNCLAVNPADGACWMSYGADPGYRWNDLGHVMARGVNLADYYDMGKPEENAWVVALAFKGGVAYALTFNFVDGKYRVYTTTDTTPQPISGSIGEVKKILADLPVGVSASLTGQKIVTYVQKKLDNSLDYIYIEEPDRSSGIRVVPLNPELTINVGDKVTVTQASNSLANGVELQLAGAVLNVTSASENPGSLASTNIALGGGKVGIQPAMTDRGYGTSTVGLLTTIWGVPIPKPGVPGQVQYATQFDPNQPNYSPVQKYYVYISDGPPGMWTGAGTVADPYVWSNDAVKADYILVWNNVINKWENIGNYVGVKVYVNDGDILPSDPFVVVTGVSGIEKSDSNFTDAGGDIVYYRTLQTRSSADVQYPTP